MESSLNEIFMNFDFEIPFTEVVDYEGIEEDCECDVTYEILDSEIRIVDSINENRKSVSVCTRIRAVIRQEKCAYTDYIKDCYFTDLERLLTDEEEAAIDEILHDSDLNQYRTADGVLFKSVEVPVKELFPDDEN